jgi:hypothetical protein
MTEKVFKPIQIAVTDAKQVFALTDDGIIWMGEYYFDEDGEQFKWTKLPAITETIPDKGYFPTSIAPSIAPPPPPPFIQS